MDTPYNRLGVPESATPEQIQKARRTLASQHHPDLHGGSREKEQRLKQINADAEELLDPVRRAALDAELASVRARARLRERKPRMAGAPAKAAPGRTTIDPLRPLWEANPLERIAEAATAGRSENDPWASLLRTFGRVADVAWKVQLRSELYGRPPRRRAPATLARCKAVKQDGRPCRNPPVPGNYGFCGVHRYN
jgi:curved DNA-binding protein CbpA